MKTVMILMKPMIMKSNDSNENDNENDRNDNEMTMIW